MRNLMKGIDVLVGDCRETLKALPDQSVNCCVTSPPYFGLRDYGTPNQIGLEETPEQFVQNLVEVFREVKRVLKDDGTLWLNLGDSYAGSGKGRNSDGSTNTCGKQETNKGTIVGKLFKAKLSGDLKPKDLIGIPWMVAFALRADGWYLRQDIIWSKNNCMPESVKDRCTKSHEYVFLLSKSKSYYFDHEAIREPASYDGRKATDLAKSKKYTDGAYLANGNSNTLHEGDRPRWKQDKNGNYVRNKRSVWHVSTQSYSGGHFAVYPPKLIEPCILAGCPEGGTVLDPFGGSGTTGAVAKLHNRNAILCELNEEYVDLMGDRVDNVYKTMTGKEHIPDEENLFGF